jgi:hypothetical protein
MFDRKKDWRREDYATAKTLIALALIALPFVLLYGYFFAPVAQ